MLFYSQGSATVNAIGWLHTRIRLPLLLLALSLGGPGIASTQQPDEPDRSTPSATFRTIQSGYKNGTFEQVIGSLSVQQKRFTLFETLFAAGMVAQDKKAEFETLFRHFKIDLEQMGQEYSDTDEFLSEFAKTIDNLDKFLADAQAILNKNTELNMRPEVVKVSIDGDRAIVTYHRISHHSRKDEGGTSVETQSTRPATIHMRNYDGKWLVCPKGEWNDPEFKWTVPKH